MSYAAAWRGGDERSRHGIPGPPTGGPRAPVSFGPNDLFWDPPRPRNIHLLHWAPRAPPNLQGRSRPPPHDCPTWPSGAPCATEAFEIYSAFNSFKSTVRLTSK